MDSERDGIKAMPVLKRMLAGSIWAGTGSIISRAAGLVSAILVARMLGSEDFGEFSLVRSTVMTILTFGSVGIGVTATRYIAQNRSCGATVRAVVDDLSVAALIVGAMTAALLFFLAPVVARDVIAAPAISAYLRIASIAVFFSALSGFQTGVLAGFESFRSIALINFLNGILTISFVVGGAWVHGVAGALVGMSMAAAGTFLLGCFLCRRCCKDALVEAPSAFIASNVSRRELIGFAVPIVLSGLLVTPVLWICSAILARAADGMHQVALFEAANQWRMLILFVPTLIAQVSLPVFSSMAGGRDFGKTFWGNVGITVFLSLVVAAILVPLSDFAMRLYGSDFHGSELVLQWLAFSAVMMAFGNVVGQAISSLGKAWHGFLLNLVWAILLVSLTDKYISEGKGAVGAAMAQCYAFAVHSLLQIAYLQITSLRTTCNLASLRSKG